MEIKLNVINDIILYDEDLTNEKKLSLLKKINREACDNCSQPLRNQNYKDDILKTVKYVKPLIENKEILKKDLAKELKISRPTLDRYLEELD